MTASASSGTQQQQQVFGVCVGVRVCVCVCVCTERCDDVMTVKACDCIDRFAKSSADVRVQISIRWSAFPRANIALETI